MKKYVLMEDEVMLFRIDAKRLDVEYAGETLVEVTNYYLVLIEKETDNDPYLLSHDLLKIYKDKAQIKQKGKTVEVYYKHGEEILQFKNAFDASKFVSKMLDVITGKNSTARVAEKVKGTINTIDDTFGIDTVKTLKNAAATGADMAMDKMASSEGKTGIFGRVLKKGKEVLQQSKVSKPKSDAQALPLSLEDKSNILKQYKEMLDNGLITQADFDKKKRELL